MLFRSHVVAGLARGAGAKLVEVSSSDDSRLRCLAYRANGATLLWLANMTAYNQTVQVEHAGGEAFGIVIDEHSFGQATTAPQDFQSDTRPLALSRLTLGAYAVALACIDDR